MLQLWFPYGGANNHFYLIMFEHIAFSERSLKSAEQIDLRDLLDDPIAQRWIVSALGNIVRFDEYFKHSTSPQAELLRMRIYKVFSELNHTQKGECYATTCKIISESSAAHKKSH